MGSPETAGDDQNVPRTTGDRTDSHCPESVGTEVTSGDQRRRYVVE